VVAAIRFCGENTRYQLSNGVPYRHSRDVKLWTQSGPEGSSCSSGIGRRDAAGAECRLSPQKPFWRML